MNQEMKKQLETVINATVSEDTQAAKDAFHAYITAKTQQILLGEAEDCDKDMDDEDEDESEDDEDESEDDDSDDKPAFLKKVKNLKRMKKKNN
ncbi:MAG: hypothetical protein CTY12_00175 [Methylotenera sp.]|nr:MAG: hypothetical protein CTY12_00175 [Methylotenera sp.]